MVDGPVDAVGQPLLAACRDQRLPGPPPATLANHDRRTAPRSICNPPSAVGQLVSRPALRGLGPQHRTFTLVPTAHLLDKGGLYAAALDFHGGRKTSVLDRPWFGRHHEE